MTEHTETMPLGEVYRYAREQQDAARAMLHEWQQRLVQRIRVERDAGRSVPEIAAECGVHPDRIYRLLRSREGAAA